MSEEHMQAALPRGDRGWKPLWGSFRGARNLNQGASDIFSYLNPLLMVLMSSRSLGATSSSGSSITRMICSSVLFVKSILQITKSK